MNDSSAIKVRGVRVVACNRRDQSSQNLFRKLQSKACGTLHRWQTDALYRTRREASCWEVVRRRKGKECKDV